MAKTTGAKEIQVHKVTLSSGKVVLLREPKIRHQDLAAKSVGDKAGSNQVLMGTMLTKELVKILVVKVDDVEMKNGIQSNEALDDHFTLREYNQITRVIGQIMGGDDTGEPQIENEFVGVT